MVSRGDVVRVRRGVFSRSELAEPEQRTARHLQLARAALETYRSGYALSHLSAVAAYGLPLPLGPADVVHLTDVSARARTRRQQGLWVHHSDSYTTEVRLVDGVVATSPARTVADCLRLWGPRVSVPIADAALHRRLVTRDDLLGELAMQCHWPGRSRVDRAVRLVDGRRESWLESYAFVRFAEWGVSLPTPQVDVLDHAGYLVARTDGCWVEDATVVELDGTAKYLRQNDGPVDPNAVWQAEKARYDRLGNLGLERVRFGLGDLLHREAMVKQLIQDRRSCGSLSRFTGSLRIPSPSGLTLL